jgi:hypothetical protein
MLVQIQDVIRNPGDDNNQSDQGSGDPDMPGLDHVRGGRELAGIGRDDERLDQLEVPAHRLLFAGHLDQFLLRRSLFLGQLDHLPLWAVDFIVA